LDEFGDQTNHFELQWMVRKLGSYSFYCLNYALLMIDHMFVLCFFESQVLATFDRALDQLRSCSVRLLRLSCAETMEPERLSTLRNSLIEGLIVV
jgi:hypothetical protein